MIIDMTKQCRDHVCDCDLQQQHDWLQDKLKCMDSLMERLEKEEDEDEELEYSEYAYEQHKQEENSKKRMFQEICALRIEWTNRKKEFESQLNTYHIDAEDVEYWKLLIQEWEDEHLDRLDRLDMLEGGVDQHEHDGLNNLLTHLENLANDLENVPERYDDELGLTTEEDEEFESNVSHTGDQSMLDLKQDLYYGDDANNHISNVLCSEDELIRCVKSGNVTRSPLSRPRVHSYSQSLSLPEEDYSEIERSTFEPEETKSEDESNYEYSVGSNSETPKSEETNVKRKSLIVSRYEDWSQNRRY